MSVPQKPIVGEGAKPASKGWSSDRARKGREEAELQNVLAEHDSFKSRVKQWHAVHADMPVGQELDAAVAEEADRFYAEARQRNELLQRFKNVIGPTLDSVIAKHFDEALLELRVILAFPPHALQEAQRRIQAGKWKTLADVKHELGHQSHRKL